VRMSAVIRIGTQGWNYDAWVGPFYPTGTRPPDFLSVYSRAFDTVEVDSTFYAVPSVNTVRGWAERVPNRFTFALKLPREITHERRFRDCEDVASLFFDRVRELGSKLGPILIQLGPDFTPRELPALASFLPLLPPDLHVAIEFRHRGWIHEGIVALLAEHRVAIALTDARWIPRRTMLTLVDQPTADFAYLRCKNLESRLRNGYAPRDIQRLAGLCREWGERGDVFAFMINGAKERAPAAAMALARKLGAS